MIVQEKLIQAIGGHYAPPDRALTRLESYVGLVAKWNPSINIVSKSTLGNIWQRHMLDSAQVFQCLRPEHRTWADLGSGGGFPGLVVAILAADLAPDLTVTLVESDKRKCSFLLQAVRLLEVNARVCNARIEALAPLNADVVSARALAPLSTLCGLAARHLSQNGVCAFLKGETASAEIHEAEKAWRFDLRRVESMTDRRSAILFLRGLSRV